MIEKISLGYLYDLTDKIYSLKKDYDVKMNKFYIRYLCHKYVFYSSEIYIIYYFNDNVCEPLIELKSNSYFNFVTNTQSNYYLILEFMNELKSHEIKFKRKTKIDKFLK
jgi:hypothetical protein